MLQREVSDMAELGYCSLEVHFVNDTGGAFVVSGLTIGPGCTWIANEAPSEGGTIAPYESAMWGVYSNDAAVSGQVQLSVAGTTRVVLDFSNTASGSSQCTAGPTDGMQAIVQQITTNEPTHAQFSVQLIP